MVWWADNLKVAKKFLEDESYAVLSPVWVSVLWSNRSSRFIFYLIEWISYTTINPGQYTNVYLSNMQILFLKTHYIRNLSLFLAKFVIYPCSANYDLSLNCPRNTLSRFLEETVIGIYANEVGLGVGVFRCMADNIPVSFICSTRVTIGYSPAA